MIQRNQSVNLICKKIMKQKTPVTVDILSNLMKRAPQSSRLFVAAREYHSIIVLPELCTAFPSSKESLTGARFLSKPTPVLLVLNNGHSVTKKLAAEVRLNTMGTAKLLSCKLK